MQSLPPSATCRNLISIQLLFQQSFEHFLFSCVFEDVRLCPFTFEIPNHPYCASNNRHGRRDVQLLQICTFEGGMVRIIRWLGISYVYRHGIPMAFNAMVPDRANSLSFDFHGRAKKNSRASPPNSRPWYRPKGLAARMNGAHHAIHIPRITIL